MTNVYAWPPVGLTGWELTTLDPISRSRSYFQGTTLSSSFQRSRRLATAHVTGIGSDSNGAGYVENLKRLLQGGRHLVRVSALAPLSVHATRGLDLTSNILQWTAAGADLMWTAGGADLTWWTGDFYLSASPTSDQGWPALAVTGLPPNKMVARPSQLITVTDGVETEASRVLTAARSDGNGAATIRTFDTFTLSGVVSIGGKESIVFEALDMPRAVQPVSGSWSYNWAFREVFEDEYEEWTELDPWR